MELPCTPCGTQPGIFKCLFAGKNKLRLPAACTVILLFPGRKMAGRFGETEPPIVPLEPIYFGNERKSPTKPTWHSSTPSPIHLLPAAVPPLIYLSGLVDRGVHVLLTRTAEEGVGRHPLALLSEGSCLPAQCPREIVVIPAKWLCRGCLNHHCARGQLHTT